MIRAVLFDLDGVVRHFDPEHGADIERRHGIPPGAIGRFAFDRPLIEDVTTGKITRTEWISRIAEHLRNSAAAAELADELRALGISTPILTNGTDNIPAEVALLDLPARFDPIFNSAGIGYIKPDRRAFAHVIDQLGLVTHHFIGVNELRHALRDHGVDVRLPGLSCDAPS